MNTRTLPPLLAALIALLLIPFTAVAVDKTRIMVVSSYHKEYAWTRLTNQGLVKALIEFGYLDDAAQGEAYTRDDFIDNGRVAVKKLWMDTKRRNSRSQIADTLRGIIAEIDRFAPQIILVGDDNAANYVGNHYIDGEVPVVFWGVNGTPLKYGLLDSVERPGHNVTGVYQSGYHLEAVVALKRLLPDIQRMALLADNTPTGRSNAKRVKRFGDEGSLPLELVEVVITNSYSEWQARALALQERVDAFFITTHNALLDDDGKHVPAKVARAWYLENIRKPEATAARHYVDNGFFSVVDDSAVAQGYEAMKMAHQILREGADPATLSPIAPAMGPFLVNRQRARQLGLEAVLESGAAMIDEVIDSSEPAR